MKKKILISLLAIIMCFALIGCGTNNNNNNSNGNNNNNQNNNGNNNNNNNGNDDPKKDDPKNEESDSLSIIEVKKEYDNDLPLGLENNYLKVNGNDIVVRVQTSGSTKQQENGPYYIYYNVYVGNDNLGLKCVRDAIYHLEGYGITMLKEFNEEEDVGVNFEFFEWDMTSSVHKGIDKEYAAISIPAGTEDKPQASLMITTDDGKLLGEYIVNIVPETTLPGPEIELYYNHSGDVLFHKKKEGKITYLTPT